MIEMCAALGPPCCWPARPPRRTPRRPTVIARDLRKLAMLALPHGIKVAYEGLSWGRTINESRRAWAVVEPADCANLGIGIDSFHASPATPLDDAATSTRTRSSSCSCRLHVAGDPLRGERIDTARHFRVFPGEGVHSAGGRAGARARPPGLPRRLQLRGLQRRLPAAAAAAVAERARRSAAGWRGRPAALDRRCRGACSCAAVCDPESGVPAEAERSVLPPPPPPLPPAARRAAWSRHTSGPGALARSQGLMNPSGRPRPAATQTSTRGRSVAFAELAQLAAETPAQAAGVCWD
jgi:hypothetical protein